ncbi:hypothetical protein [Rickettsiella massiliensis]|uniref:hypothetical protein n=1 Tax=Rickettsiella massiliensis TaxID=676517 RepID=UPI00029AA36E|nr:hypothetical protein [Rickettsiella massiliensis]
MSLFFSRSGLIEDRNESKSLLEASVVFFVEDGSETKKDLSAISLQGEDRSFLQKLCHFVHSKEFF